MERNTMLEKWQFGVQIMHLSHNLAATHFGRMNVILGVPVVILTTVVSTTVFSSIESTSPGAVSGNTLQIVTGLMSISAAVFAALQTFLRYPERAEQHKQAAVRYGKLRRELAQHISSRTAVDEEPFLTRFRMEWDELDKNAPQVPKKLYLQSVKTVKAVK